MPAEEEKKPKDTKMDDGNPEDEPKIKPLDE
jgi:hypothetical protein